MSDSTPPSVLKGPNNGWSESIVDVLRRVMINSAFLSDHHRERFLYFRGFSKYFDVPVLVLSILGSSFAVGTQHYLSQRTISAISCLVGVVVSIITSVKLYLSIEDTMHSEYKMSKQFYSLTIDIRRVLLLSPKERGENGLSYMQKSFATYSKLMEESNLFKFQFKGDQLIPDGTAMPRYRLFKRQKLNDMLKPVMYPFSSHQATEDEDVHLPYEEELIGTPVPLEDIRIDDADEEAKI